MFNFFSRPRHIPVTPINTHRIRCSTPRSVPPAPRTSPYSRLPPPPRKRYAAGLGPHRVDGRTLRPQKSLKARRSINGGAAQPTRTHSRPLTSEHPTHKVDNDVRPSPDAVYNDDEIFLRQFELLHVSRAFREELTKARVLAARSAEHAPALSKAREERIKREKERQRMQIELEKHQEMMARVEKRRREALRLFAKNAHRVAKERFRANLPRKPSAEQARDVFARYDDEWDVLKSEICERTQPIHFTQMPWPVLARITRPDQITYSAVEEFLFHPLRPAKSPKDRLRAEIMKWHPDKFDRKILSKVMVEHIDLVKEASGRVARILTQMMMKIETGSQAT